MSDRDKLKEKIAEAIEKAANSFTDGYCPTPYEMTSVSDCLEFAEAALIAIEEAGYVITPEAPSGGVLIGKSLHHLNDDDLCQAKSSTQGETVSREGALQAEALAEAIKKVSWQPDQFHIRRDENGQIFISADGQPIMDFTARVALEMGEALVTLAANSQSQIEEAQRADTMPLTSGGQPDTNKSSPTEETDV